jgi:uncharacterized protein YndB with AHSA1/START domain
MEPVPTGELQCLPDGRRQLVLKRTLPATSIELWSHLTDSDRTSTWFGPWRGIGRKGETVSIIWMAEEGQPEGEMTIIDCDPNRFLALRSGSEDEGGIWEMDIELVEEKDATTLVFQQQLGPDVPAAMVGAGWEYYLDRFVAAWNSEPMPAWDSYFPAQNAYFEELDARLTCS